MLSRREIDEFERMRLLERIERCRHLIGMYHEHQSFYHGEIETSQHQLGRIAERLEAHR